MTANTVASWLTVILWLGAIAALTYLAATLFDLVTEHDWTQRQERDTSPHAFDALVTAEHDEYAAAADLAPPSWVGHAEDGCWESDHALGVHSAFYAVVTSPEVGGKVVRLPGGGA